MDGREWHNTQQGCASKTGSGKPTSLCFGVASSCFLFISFRGGIGDLEAWIFGI